MYDRLKVFENKYNILTEGQIGFRENKYTDNCNSVFHCENAQSTGKWVTGNWHVF
jgi:hypothetical protein